jgi:hypothetical protein
MDDTSVIQTVAAVLFLAVPLISGIVIAYLIVRKPLGTQAPQIVGPAVLCSGCGKYSRPGSSFCAACGARMTVDNGPISVDPASSPPPLP